MCVYRPDDALYPLSCSLSCRRSVYSSRERSNHASRHRVQQSLGHKEKRPSRLLRKRRLVFRLLARWDSFPTQHRAKEPEQPARPKAYTLTWLVLLLKVYLLHVDETFQSCRLLCSVEQQWVRAAGDVFLHSAEALLIKDQLRPHLERKTML